MAIENVNVQKISIPGGSWNYGQKELPAIADGVKTTIEEKLNTQTNGQVKNLADFSKLNAQQIDEMNLGWVSAILNDPSSFDEKSELDALFNGLGDSIKLSDAAKDQLNPGAMPTLPVNPDHLDPEKLEGGVKRLQDMCKDGKFDAAKIDEGLDDVGKQKKDNENHFNALIKVKSNQFTAEYEKQRNDKIEEVYGNLHKGDIKKSNDIAGYGKVVDAQKNDAAKVAKKYGWEKNDESKVTEYTGNISKFAPTSADNTTPAKVDELKAKINDYAKTDNIAELTGKKAMFDGVGGVVTDAAVQTAQGNVDKATGAKTKVDAYKADTSNPKTATQPSDEEYQEANNLEKYETELQRLKDIKQYLGETGDKIDKQIEAKKGERTKALGEITSGKGDAAKETAPAVKAKADEKAAVKTEIEGIQAKVKAGNIDDIEIPGDDKVKDKSGLESIKKDMLALKGKRTEREKKLVELENTLNEAKEQLAAEKEAEKGKAKSAGKSKSGSSGDLPETLGKIFDLIGKFANIGLQAQQADAYNKAMSGAQNMQLPNLGGVYPGGPTAPNIPGMTPNYALAAQISNTNVLPMGMFGSAAAGTGAASPAGMIGKANPAAGQNLNIVG